MRLIVDLEEFFGKPGSVSFEESISDACPEALRAKIADDLRALLKVFGGLALGVVEDISMRDPGEDAGSLMGRLMRSLEQFCEEKLAREKRAP